MRILGIDPALTKSGWAIVERKGNVSIYIASGVIKTDSKEPLAQRLKLIYTTISDVISKYQPNLAAIEETFVNKNAATSLKLGCARGAVITCLAMHDLEVMEFTPKYIKKSLTGSGSADKNQMLKMITLLMPQAKVQYDDEADAIAIALAA